MIETLTKMATSTQRIHAIILRAPLLTTGKAVLIQILMAIQTQNKAGVQIMVQMLSLTNNLSGKIQIMMALVII